jgi:hypothetical protein
MGDGHRWMYDGWKRNGAHTDEWWDNTNNFMPKLSLSTTEKIRYPCVKYQNERCFDKVILTKHQVRNGFTTYYKMWVFHGEKYTKVTAEEFVNDQAGADRMDEILEAIRPEFDLDTKDPPTPEVEEFFKLLKALKEPLHEHTKLTMLAFMTRLMAIKSKFFFSNNCYNELMKLVGDVLLNPNKLSIDLYHSKKFFKGSIWIMRRLKSAKIVVCLFGRNTKKKTNV